MAKSQDIASDPVAVGRLSRETMAVFFGDLAKVLQASEVGAELWTAETVPASIQDQPPVAEFVNDKSLPRSSLAAKFVAHAADPQGIFGVYYDFKVAVVSELVRYPAGSEKYARVYDFFRFFVELLLAEGQRLGLARSNSVTVATLEGGVGRPEEHAAATRRSTRAAQDERSLVKDEDRNGNPHSFEQEVTTGYEKMSADYTEWFGEAYYLPTDQGPLFSSLSGKASIDPRDTTTRGDFRTTNVLPYVQVTRPYPLGFLSTVVSRAPHPALFPTQILKDFVNPSQAELPHSNWLKYDTYASFAPVRLESGAILNDSDTRAIWYERFGHQRLLTEEEVRDLEQELQNINEPDGNDTDRMDVDEDEDKKEGKEANEDKAESEDSKDNTGGSFAAAGIDISSLDGSPLSEEDLVAAFEWGPDQFVDDDELEAAESGSEKRLVTQLILQLQQVQRVRLSQTDGSQFVVSPEERRLAHKVQNLLLRLVSASGVTPKSINVKPSPLLPVMQTSYPGVLEPLEPRMMYQQQPRMAGAKLSKQYRAIRR